MNDYWVVGFEGGSELTFDQVNGAAHTCAAMLFEPDAVIGDLYTGDADGSVLSLRYNMVHEVLFPLFDELSLSVGADGFLFRGAAPTTHKPGFSLMLRVGLTYDRLWKPRYQPFF